MPNAARGNWRNCARHGWRSQRTLQGEFRAIAKYPPERSCVIAGAAPDSDPALTPAVLESTLGRIAAQAARKRRGRLTMVDKANVLEASRLWRSVSARLMSAEFPDVKYDVVSDPKLPVAQAVKASNNDAILRAFNIEAFGKDDSMVIDVGPLFTSDIYELSARQFLRATTLDASRTFYHDTLGLEILREDEDDRIVFRCGGGTQLVVTKSTIGTMDSQTQLAWRVPDIRAALADLRGRGVHIEEYEAPAPVTVDGVADMGHSWAAWFVDPSRNVLSVVQPKG